MTIQDGIVLLDYTDLVNATCLSVAQYKHAVANGRVVLARKGGGAGRTALIDWPSLYNPYKELVKAFLGSDPEELAKAQNIERFLRLSPADESFIDSYRSTNGLLLSNAKREAMKKAAPVLALLAQLDELRRTIGSEGIARTYGMPTMALKAAILQYIKLRDLSLPSSFSKLEARKRAYIDAVANGQPGAASMVHGAHGNKNSCKLASDDQVAVLRLLASRHQNFGPTTIASHYNQVAAMRDWPTITGGTVKNFLRSGTNGRTATIYAKGIGAYRDTYDLVNHRSRPSSPTLMWVIDGDVYELYYQKTLEVAGRQKTAYHLRKTVVVVLDPHNWYPVGYAIGDVENTDLNKAAMKNAVEHMRELTGNYWLPWQMQSDRFAKEELKQAYQRYAVYYTPQRRKNPRSKVIEPYFNYHHNKYIKGQVYLNYGGHNIDSRKENQPNPEALERLKKEFPDEAGVIAQIHSNFHRERLDKRDEFLRGLEAMDAERRRVIDRARFLELFGTPHLLTNGQSGNVLTNAGLQPTILGARRCYNLLTTDFQDLVGTSFTLTYDPADLSEVLATARDGSIRYVVPAMAKVPMALMDHTEETRARLAHQEAFKRELGTNAMNLLQGDAERVQVLAARFIEEARPQLPPEREAVVRARVLDNGSHKAALAAAPVVSGWTDEELRRFEQAGHDQL